MRHDATGHRENPLSAFGVGSLRFSCTMDQLTRTSILIHSLTNIAGVATNGFLVWLILKKTPPILRVYSILLLNFAITDLVTCLAAAFVMQR